MSMSEDDYAYDEYMSDLYEEHKKEAIEEFTSERLSSYYSENQLLAIPVFDALLKARKLNESDSTAGLIFAAIAMEVGLKVMLLKPIVYGLVHDESVASLITDLAVSRTNMNQYKTLLFNILQEHGGFNLKAFKRSESSKTLWEEIKQIQNIRNKIMHKAETASKENTTLSLKVASEIIDNIFPKIVVKMGFHLHDDYKICSDFPCKYKKTIQNNYFDKVGLS